MCAHFKNLSLESFGVRFGRAFLGLPVSDARVSSSAVPVRTLSAGFGCRCGKGHAPVRSNYRQRSTMYTAGDGSEGGMLRPGRGTPTRPRGQGSSYLGLLKSVFAFEVRVALCGYSSSCGAPLLGPRALFTGGLAFISPPTGILNAGSPPPAAGELIARGVKYSITWFAFSVRALACVGEPWLLIMIACRTEIPEVTAQSHMVNVRAARAWQLCS